MLWGLALRRYASPVKRKKHMLSISAISIDDIPIRKKKRKSTKREGCPCPVVPFVFVFFVCGPHDIIPLPPVERSKEREREREMELNIVPQAFSLI